MEPNSTAKRLLALLIQNLLQHLILNINTNTLAVAANIKSNITFTIITAYINEMTPPHIAYA